jgi:hypothetical protein
MYGQHKLKQHFDKCTHYSCMADFSQRCIQLRGPVSEVDEDGSQGHQAQGGTGWGPNDFSIK